MSRPDFSSLLSIVTIYLAFDDYPLFLYRDSLSLKHGQTYSFIIQTPTPLGPVHRVQLTWEKQRPSLLQVPCLLWCPDVKLAVAQVTLLDMHRTHRSVTSRDAAIGWESHWMGGGEN